MDTDKHGFASEHIRELVDFRIQTEKFRQRTEENLAEITVKLNGLIGYVADRRPSGTPKT